MKFFILGLYFAALIVIGFYSAKKSRDVGGFFLGSRNVGPWISAFAYGTSLATPAFSREHLARVFGSGRVSTVTSKGLVTDDLGFGK